MASSLHTAQTATVIPFRPRQEPVERTDRRRRLPALSSAEVENIFDHLNRANQDARKAA